MPYNLNILRVVVWPTSILFKVGKCWVVEYFCPGSALCFNSIDINVCPELIEEPGHFQMTIFGIRG